MSGVLLAADVLGESAEALGSLSDDFNDVLEGRPTLCELLDIFGWGLPANCDHVEGPYPVPLRFKAKLGNRNYKAAREPRTDELNDAVFSGAAELLGSLAKSAAEAVGRPVALSGLASGLAAVFRASSFYF